MGVKTAMAPTLVGMVEAVPKLRPHLERLRKVAIIVDKAHKKSAIAP